MEKNYIEEKNISTSPKPIPVEELYNILLLFRSNVCKINYGNGTGFFCKITRGREALRVLITNDHVLKKENITPGKLINFSINNEERFYNISIDESRITYNDPKNDITIIQIKEEDKLDKISFFDIDEKIFENNSIEYFKKKTNIFITLSERGKNEDFNWDYYRYI